ncbi:ion transporter [Streptococcus plurextorum]|uniref:ion transporter n=1 Tax=Streptococcus plurextorum TaxID=456876 RepID=UPI00042171B7|nr:ion transporter [Streptococcus plurextorum]
MRNNLFKMLTMQDRRFRPSVYYNYFMIFVIVLSLIPLMTKSHSSLLQLLEVLTFFVFALDYILRWSVADSLLGKEAKSFLIYPFTFWAILDLLCLLPYVTLLNNSFKLLKLFRMIRALRVVKLFRYSKNIEIIISVLKKQREALFIVGMLAISYIFISALLLFNLEPQTFENFFDAIYWATISLTTVGYGDIYARTVLGKTLTMISALLGVAIVALPAGIITAGYMEELSKHKNS